MGVAEVTTWYELAVPHIPSPPGAVQVSVDSATLARIGCPGGIASRVQSPELAMSWWKFGHELGEHADAGVEYTDTTPSRVIETTSFFASGLVSSVPSEPSVGVATIQPPVSFGHALVASLPAPSNAWRSSDAVPPRTSCLGAPPVMS